jgi:hypothetical protein
MTIPYICSKSGRIVGNELATLGDGFFVDPEFLSSCDCNGACKIKKEESKDSSFHLTALAD